MPHRITSMFVKSEFYFLAMVISTVLFLSGPGHAQASDQKVFVLCYHSFLGNKFPSDITMDELRTQLDYLKDKGFGFVSYTDLLKGDINGTKNILIVIDDGNHSILQAYRQILKPRGIK
ncbi:hypothetical protein EG833_02340, partial [archaeon]|nr:hypothetical protein [archaeon]